ncbi:TetR/AcrR family transcriptional regulator [Cryptosporangium aurantiacum]|uniref:Transcriptional regulator, TetR family n=1 Tax=Cryptosporangium aurantiacum TaxID=134849 RepID=A0A1M7HWJ6_9ACTN|nr:TetR/AcrR family transcriptional regulator [Cryptosporangium aurantiacum]SHM32798.1 transcriptional regulator, TetR family [Cryptosporangium aurantiacum]
MATRDDWIERGLEVLAQDGLPGVRIDRIAAQLGVSKGSFHHHFAGAAGYRQALAQRYEERVLAELSRVAGSAQGLGFGLFDRLVEALDDLYDARLETAMRAWALHDDVARDVMSKVDDARLRVLQDGWSAVLPHEDAARIAALVPHLVVVGASAAALPAADLRSVLQLLGGLAPSVPGVLGGDGRDSAAGRAGDSAPGPGGESAAGRGARSS